MELFLLKSKDSINLKGFFKIIVILLILSGCKDKNIKTLDYIEIVPNDVKNMVILLHGYGSNNSNMLPIAQELSGSFPNTAFILPNAPFPIKGGFSRGFQWFSLNRPEFIMRKEAKKANAILNNFIKDQRNRFLLKNDNVFIAGFSQGAILSIYNGLRQKQEFAGIISFSGLLPDTEELLRKEIKSKPNILLINGTNDDMVAYSNMAKAEEVFDSLKIPYRAHTLNGIGHVITPEAILYAKEFIKENIKNK